MKFRKIIMLLPMLVLASTLLHAHTELKESQPANGAVLHAAPAALALNFSEDVQLLKVELHGPAGTVVNTGFVPVTALSKTFSIPLQDIVTGEYHVGWTILGKDGHRVEGALAFTVDPEATESTGSTEHHADHRKR